MITNIVMAFAMDLVRFINEILSVIVWKLKL